MAELSIRWQAVERISNEPSAVVTGDSASEAESEESLLLWDDKPIIVYVCDESTGCEGFDKLNDQILQDEKIALGMKAFRTVKMHPDDVAEDAILKDNGKEVPRLLVVDPIKLKVKVLEKGKLKTSGLYSTMKSVSARFYKEKLDGVVKSHLKLLTEQDQLANAEKVLHGKIARLKGEDGRSAEKELEKVEKEMAEVRDELVALREKTKALWELTPKAA